MPVFLRIAAEGLDDADYKPGELDIHGDALFAQKFARALSELDIDWEELLAQRVGDIPARFIGRNVNEGLQWAKYAQGKLKQVVSDFLTGSGNLAARKSEVTGFVEQVDDLRSDVARLEARISKLRAAK
jgi:ubiquinone biosynthesis protein UbiJ